MRRLFTIAMCLALFGLHSCSSDDDSKAKVIKLIVRYEIEGDIDLKADVGAKVYLFSDVLEERGHIYEIGGVFKTVSGSSITADKAPVIVGEDGIVKVRPGFANRPVAVAVESEYFKGQYEVQYLPKLVEDALVLVYFYGE